MKCKCNPSRAEFGNWRGVRRCAICGKIFHTGWRCRPQCETSIIEDCLREDSVFVEKECPAPEAEECRPECEPENKQDHCHPISDKQVSDPPPDVAETHQDETPILRGEWAQVFPRERFEEPREAGHEQLWPLEELTDQLPPDPH